MIKTTPLNIWEFDCSDADIILFVKMEKMYMDTWKDEVFDRVNDMIHFKNRLKNTI